MFNWIYRVADGVFLRGGPVEVIAESGEAVVVLARHPKPRAERYDGAGGIRAATVDEIAAYEVAQKQAQVSSAFDGNKDLLALSMWVAQRMTVSLATARQEILTIRRSL